MIPWTQLQHCFHCQAHLQQVTAWFLFRQIHVVVLHLQIQSQWLMMLPITTRTSVARSQWQSWVHRQWCHTALQQCIIKLDLDLTSHFYLFCYFSLHSCFYSKRLTKVRRLYNYIKVLNGLLCAVKKLLTHSLTHSLLELYHMFIVHILISNCFITIIKERNLYFVSQADNKYVDGLVSTHLNCYLCCQMNESEKWNLWQRLAVVLTMWENRMSCYHTSIHPSIHTWICCECVKSIEI